MAELIITDAERATKTYLEWDDASIGRAVKKLATTVADDNGLKSIEWFAAALLLVNFAVEANAEHSEHEIKGVTLDNGERAVGDWIVRLDRVDKEHKQPTCKHCGDLTMHAGDVCYACYQAIEDAE